MSSVKGNCSSTVELYTYLAIPKVPALFDAEINGDGEMSFNQPGKHLTATKSAVCG